MATLEEFGVLLQLNDQLFRLVRNMRSNANGYTSAANRIDAGTSQGFTVQQLAAVMNRDGLQFVARLQTLTDIAQRNQTLVQNALAIIGVTLASANATKNTVLATAQHLRDASLNTTQACRDEASFVLANTPAYDGMF